MGLKNGNHTCPTNRKSNIDLNEVTKLKFLKFEEVFEKKEATLGLKAKFMMQMYNLCEKNERFNTLARLDNEIEDNLKVMTDEQYQVKKYFTSKTLDRMRSKLINAMIKRRVKRLDEIMNLSIDRKHHKIDEEIELIVKYFLPRQKDNMNE